MDAIKFLKESKRMCSHIWREDCPFHKYDCAFIRDAEDIEEIVETVEKWSKEQPVKTRQSEFLKMFPNASIENGTVNIYPCDIDATTELLENGEYCVSLDGNCSKCKEVYWHMEID